MALKPCRECKTEVSNGAKNCPHCGVKWPTATGSMRWDRLAIVAALILAIGYLINVRVDKADASKNASEQANPTCVSDWTKCKDNSDLANHWSGYDAVQNACKYATNDRAKYDTPKYTSPYYFISFQPGSSASETGKMHVIDKDVKVQNGFGAWARTRVVCEYDLRNKKVLNVAFTDR
jgi:hypothetical protein